MKWLYHRLKPANPLALSGRGRIPKEPPEIFEVPEFTIIEATGILEADAEFERQTGINPVKYKNHTPPITVRKLEASDHPVASSE